MRVWCLDWLWSKQGLGDLEKGVRNKIVQNERVSSERMGLLYDSPKEFEGTGLMKRSCKICGNKLESAFMDSKNWLWIGLSFIGTYAVVATGVVIWMEVIGADWEDWVVGLLMAPFIVYLFGLLLGMYSYSLFKGCRER